MSFDGTVPVLWCLMSIETCFLTIRNDLERRFWLKNSHFLGFWRWRERKNGVVWLLVRAISSFHLGMSETDWVKSRIHQPIFTPSPFFPLSAHFIFLHSLLCYSYTPFIAYCTPLLFFKFIFHLFLLLLLSFYLFLL